MSRYIVRYEHRADPSDRGKVVFETRKEADQHVKTWITEEITEEKETVELDDEQLDMLAEFQENLVAAVLPADIDELLEEWNSIVEDGFGEHKLEIL